MKPRPLAFLAASSLLTLTSCFGGGTSYSYQNVTVAISPQVASIQAGATQSFSTTTTNAPNIPIWSINGTSATPNTASIVGSFSGNDITPNTYTAPATPPIYTQTQVASGYVQGSVVIGASVIDSATNFFAQQFTSTTVAIVGPISAGLLPTSATVKLGATLQLSPYVVGTLTNGYTLKVNGFTGGGTDVGTISATGLYTAPATMPLSGSTITVTITSIADSTKTGTAILTLQ
jgi:hypothetical protein